MQQYTTNLTTGEVDLTARIDDLLGDVFQVALGYYLALNFSEGHSEYFACELLTQRCRLITSVPPDESSRRKKKNIVSANLRRRVFERDAYRCCHCGDWHDLCVDHIVPESKGGPTTLDNLQTLCRACNSRKGVRL